MATDTAGGSLLVGIGASAGGLEACREFFEAMPPKSGMVFAVVLHLDRHRASHVAEILQRHTSMTVTQAEGDLSLERDHVYIIAPNTELSIRDDRIEVEPLAEHPAHEGLIDALFSSLCDDHGKRCVGIVLSGSGHDGASGLQNIRAAGGLCIAQDPPSAQFSSMPEAAIDGGAVHAVAAPADMPAVLLEFARTGAPPEDTAADGEAQDAEIEQGSDFEAVLAVLGKRFDTDFRDYKDGTLQRRIRRRMGLGNIRDWDRYVAHLREDPNEVAALYRDVLIGVTAFFRDPEVWERLARELPALLEGRSEPGIRAWVPGCATGEEAYTLAMLLFEQFSDGARPTIQIYATDLSTAALAVARRGLYPRDIVRDVSEERIARFFRLRDDRLQLDPRLRECVTFAPHNALTDAPFSRMDLVSCRNLLIYLEADAQERLLRRLNFSLREGGLLVLGRSETSGHQSGLFEEIEKRQGLYRARAGSADRTYQLTHRTADHVRGAELPPHGAEAEPRSRNSSTQRRIEQFVLTHRTPARIVIDRDLQIVHFYGDTYPYLVTPTGESRQDLLSWVRSGFYIPLRAALKRAFEEKASITVEGQVDRNGRVVRVQCVIEPVPATVGANEFLLLTFHDVPAARDEVRAVERVPAEEPLARQLEAELIDTKRELQGAVEQLEAAGEEYRASHEELLSLNEELQSSNEELEASKEELESLNEEMNTINKELEEKNAELRGANADLANLFTSSGIPTIFLDRDLRVRRYTSAATDVMRLVPADVGRSIEHIKERFQDRRLVTDANDVAQQGLPLEAEVQSEDGRWFLRRIAPYRLADDRIEGVCITFSDVTAQKQAAQENEAARSYAETIVRSIHMPLMILDERLHIVSANRAFHDTFHTTPEELQGQTIDVVQDRRWNVEGLPPLLAQTLTEQQEVTDFEVTSAHSTMLVNAYALISSSESKQILLSIEDVTDRMEVQRAAEKRASELTDDARQKDQWIAMLGHELRNPIGAVSNGLELLDGKVDAVRQAAVRAMMRRQLEQVGQLLDGLLDAARVIAGKLEILHAPVDLTGVTEAAIEATAPVMDERRHELSVSLPPPGTVLVSGDRSRLTEVVENLLTNAAKYTDDGGKIELGIDSDRDTVTLSVQDTGIGIPAALMPRIFDVFTQGPRNLDRASKGLGLGLPLVRTIVELHGGEVEAFSEGEGQGSRFEVRLPRIGNPSAHPESPRAAREQPPRRVLVVEDQADAATMLEQILQRQGHETRVAQDGEAALQAAAEFAPDVVLLDIGLPKMDGYEVAKRMRAQGEKALLIAVTGYNHDEARLRDAKFDHHLIKPIDFRRLSAWLAKPKPAN